MVFKFEAVIPTVTYPISNIIDMLCGMEFNTNEILGSLQMNEYDETNGDIFDFKRRGHKVFAGASTISAKPVDPCPSPPPSPAHPSLYELPPKRRASEPNL